MMYRINILIIIFFFSLVCLAQEKNTSKCIYEVQKRACDKIYLEVFEYNREKVGWIDTIEKSQVDDTIYILEEYYRNSERLYEKYTAGSMWKKNNAKNSDEAIKISLDSYYKETGEIVKYSDRRFSSYILYLINEWNIKEIEEQDKKNKFINTSEMIATRIIIHDNCKQIESICFGEFINMDMDRKYDPIINKY